MEHGKYSSLRKKRQEEERLCAVALDQVAVLSAKPVARREQHPLPERSSKLAVHSHQRIAEHHVGLVPEVHKWVPKQFARCPLGGKPEPRALGPAALRGPPRLATSPSNASCRLVEFAIPTPPCTTRVCCSYVVLETPDRLMLYQSEPSKPTRCCFGHSCHDPFARRPMKKHNLHPSVYEKMDMQQAADTMRMYYPT